MPRKQITFDTVRRIALALPDVEESTSYGASAFKVRGKRLAGIPVNRAAEPDSLGVAIDYEQRAELLATAPDVYYLPDHYVNYPVVLVRLSRIDVELLKDLLAMAWKVATAKAPPRKRVLAKRRLQ